MERLSMQMEGFNWAENMVEDLASDPVLLARCRTARALAGPGTTIYLEWLADVVEDQYDSMYPTGPGWFPRSPGDPTSADQWARQFFADDAPWLHFGSGTHQGTNWDAFGSTLISPMGLLLFTDPATGEHALLTYLFN